MKTRSRRVFAGLALLAVLSTVNIQHSTAFGQGTAFMYQGHLSDAGSSANGSYDIAFTIFGTNNGGTALAIPLTNLATAVSNGLFNVTLDFGSGVFTGNSCWMDIAVQTNGGNGFTELTPRQPLLPVPYAIMANSASNVLGTLSATQLSGAIQNSSFPANPTFSGTITAAGFSGNGGGLTNVPVSWQPVSGTNQAAASNQSYLLTNNAGVAVGLPAAPGIGDIVTVTGTGTNGWQVYPAAGQSIAGEAVVWTLQTNAPTSTNWFSITSSADGSKLAAVAIGGGIYVSTNFGVTWIQTLGAPGFFGITCSADGTKMAACGATGFAISTNSGATWAQNRAEVGPVFSIASSADGTILAAAENEGGIEISTDSGAQWTQTAAPVEAWTAIACSANGSELVAVAENPQQVIYISQDAGFFWAETSAPQEQWTAVVSSADGNKLAAASEGFPGGIYTMGFGWNPTSAGQGNWKSLACSADGTKLAAAQDGGGIYTSTNSGVTWEQSSAPSEDWFSIASSADGTKLAAVVGGGGIYTSGTSLPYMGAKGQMVQFQYIGNGQWLPLSIPASQITGILSVAQMPGVVVTNLESGVTLSGTFSGSGTGLTNLNASQLTAGMVPLAQLPSQVLTNSEASVMLNGTFSGDGSGLTGLITPTIGNYLYSYSTTTQAVTTASTFQNITNDTDAQINGWIHTPGTTSYTNAQSGLYQVQYAAEALTTANVTTTISVRALDNGVEIPGSQATAVANTGNQTVSISRSFIASFSSGDALQFQFAGSSTNDRLVSNFGLGTTRPSFSVTIVRIQ